MRAWHTGESRYLIFSNEWKNREEKKVVIYDCPWWGRRPGEDAEQWERYGLLHLCTCLFIVTAAGIQNLTGESQTADGLQIISLQFGLKNYTNTNKAEWNGIFRAVKTHSAIEFSSFYTTFITLHGSQTSTSCIWVKSFAWNKIWNVRSPLHIFVKSKLIW